MPGSPRLTRCIAVVSLTIAWSGLNAQGAAPLPPDEAKPSAEAVDKAEKAIKEKFTPLQAEYAPPVMHLTGAGLERAFPTHLFFAAVYRMHPVARLAPEPLHSQNLFVVNKDGKIEHLTSTKELEKFFQAQLGPVTTDKAATDAVDAWLRLSQALKQDGFYQFAVPKDAISVTEKDKGRQAAGKAVAERGGRGEFSVVLTFDEAGKLAGMEETNQLKEGVRPICQATKLLDPDSIVRRMAEKDILVMGQAAREYLFEQRAKARPELQQAIDRLWKRIIDEGW